MKRNLLFLALLLFLIPPESSFAQSSPFGGPRPPFTESSTGIGIWLLQQQAAFHRAMISAFRAADGSMLGQATLLWLAFLYGVFHAIGPGHGKAVIASYIVANENQARRGIALAFAAALVQSLIALSLVLIVILLLGQTAKSVDGVVIWLERLGFAIILALGAAITIRKARILFGYDDQTACAHDHGADLVQNTPQSRRGFIALAIGAGLRPCTGAIILLVFALSLGQFLTGALAVGMMAFGTAIGTSFFALLAVKAKHFALRLASGGSAGRIILALEALAGLVLAVLGLLMITATISSGG